MYCLLQVALQQLSTDLLMTGSCSDFEVAPDHNCRTRELATGCVSPFMPRTTPSAGQGYPSSGLAGTLSWPMFIVI